VRLAAVAALLALALGAAGPSAARELRGRDGVVVGELEGAAEQGALLRGRAPVGATIRLDGQHVSVAADGRFVIGLDRDQGPRADLDIVLAGEAALRNIAIEVAPRAWRIERVNVARRLPQEGSEAWRLREAEVLRMNAARERSTGAEGSAGGSARSESIAASRAASTAASTSRPAWARRWWRRRTGWWCSPAGRRSAWRATSSSSTMAMASAAPSCT
jgi:hypothetical protein